MTLQETGQGSGPPPTAADPDPARRPLALGGTGCPMAMGSAAAGFPDDAVVEILSRLPAKSLCRSKCVSKDWCQLISDRLRCTKLPQRLEGFFYECVDDVTTISSDGYCDLCCVNGDENGGEDSDKSCGEDGDQGCIDDANEGAGDRGLGDDGGEYGSKDEELPQHIPGQYINLSGIPVPLVDPLFSSLRKHTGIRNLALLDSCNGLLLFGRTLDPNFYIARSYIVYNPATEHWVPVPSSGDKYSSVAWDIDEDIVFDESDTRLVTYLIFDPVASSHFQLIEFFDHSPYVTVVYAYSSETRKWNTVSEREGWQKGVEWDLLKTIDYMRGSTVFNKMLHLIVSPSSVGPELIIALNGKGETCKVISWQGNRGFPIFVGQSKGLLHCLSVSGHPDGNPCHMTELSIWVLVDYDADEWKLKQTVSFLELFGKQSCHFESDYIVVTLHPEYNLIFFVQHWDYKLVSYDMDCKELHTLCTVGCDYEPVIPYVPYFSEAPVLSKKALCNCFELGYICSN